MKNPQHEGYFEATPVSNVTKLTSMFNLNLFRQYTSPMFSISFITHLVLA